MNLSTSSLPQFHRETTSAPGRRTLYDLIVPAVLALATFAIYARAITFDFVAYDDYGIIVDNLNIHRGLTWATLHWAFTSVVYFYYNPVTVVTQLAVSSLFGTGPAGFHAVSVLLHAGSVALFYVFLRRTGSHLWIAAAAVALWGWHPLRIESVAWIAELKDVLCGFFWLLTLLAYLRHSRTRHLRDYGLVLLAYAASLGSKPMAVTLPFVLLLMDVYPLRRLRLWTLWSDRRDWLFAAAEKLPMLALALFQSAMTLGAQRGAVQPFSLPTRVANAVVAYGDYLRDIVLPLRLAVLYPHPAILGHPVPIAPLIASSVLLMTLSVAFLWLAHRGQPALLIGWLWFLGSLLPVVGLIQVGDQARADRYTYIPVLGLTTGIAWAASRWLIGKARRQLVSVTASVVVVTALASLLVATERQLSYWKNSDTLFLHAAAVTDDNYLAYAELANVRLKDGRADAALSLVDESLRIRPNGTYSLATRGLALVHLNRSNEALAAFAQAIRIAPKDADFRRDAGDVLMSLKRNREAEIQFKTSLELAPNAARTHDDYAALLANQGRFPEAISQWQEALAIDPSFADAHAGLARAAYLGGDIATAIAQYQSAVYLAEQPINPDWLQNLAWLEATKPDASADEIDDALARATEAVPDQSTASPLALDTLAAALARAGQFDRAATLARKAVETARGAGNVSLAQSIQSRMDGYANGKPYISHH